MEQTRTTWARRHGLDALLGLALLLNAVGLLLWLARPCITQAQADAIRPGMTRAEVERVVGRPGYHGLRHLCKPQCENGLKQLDFLWDGTICAIDRWHGDGGDLKVGFDETGTVRAVSFTPRPRARILRDCLDRVARRLP
jgi:hypothetical protein